MAIMVFKSLKIEDGLIHSTITLLATEIDLLQSVRKHTHTHARARTHTHTHTHTHIHTQI